MNHTIERIVCDNPLLRDTELMRRILHEICSITDTHYHIMEVCGGQTNTIVRYGIEELIPSNIHLIHGPGCPVCVTPQSIIDIAIQLSEDKNICICSFGDMMRVPGSKISLLEAKSKGRDIRLLYSPLDIISLANEEPEKEFVFLAIGFETTLPIYSLLLKSIELYKIPNISLLTSLFTVPAAIRSIVTNAECKVDAFLAAGNVCAVMGTEEYYHLAQEIRCPIIITGFEPIDILEGIRLCLYQLKKGDALVKNPYFRVVNESGNIRAKEDITKYFVQCDCEWRGLGIIPNSGMCISKKYEPYDATKRFHITKAKTLNTNNRCIAGEIMKGTKKVFDCQYLGNTCTPEHPIGAPMVSSEGICASIFANAKI